MKKVFATGEIYIIDTMNTAKDTANKRGFWKQSSGTLTEANGNSEAATYEFNHNLDHNWS